MIFVWTTYKVVLDSIVVHWCIQVNYYICSTYLARCTNEIGTCQRWISPKFDITLSTIKIYKPWSASVLTCHACMRLTKYWICKPHGTSSLIYVIWVIASLFTRSNWWGNCERVLCGWDKVHVAGKRMCGAVTTICDVWKCVLISKGNWAGNVTYISVSCLVW